MCLPLMESEQEFLYQFFVKTYPHPMNQIAIPHKAPIAPALTNPLEIPPCDTHSAALHTSLETPSPTPYYSGTRYSTQSH